MTLIKAPQIALAKDNTVGTIRKLLSAKTTPDNEKSPKKQKNE